MKVYVLIDTNMMETLSVHKTMEGARKSLLAFLKTAYRKYEWRELAEEHGYATEEEFDSAILTSKRYDAGMMMDIKEVEIMD